MSEKKSPLVEFELHVKNRPKPKYPIIGTMEKEYDRVEVTEWLEGLVGKTQELCTFFDKEPALRKCSGKDWAWWFYNELGYRITDSDEDEEILKKTMDGLLDRLSLSVAGKERSLRKLLRQRIAYIKTEGYSPYQNLKLDKQADFANFGDGTIGFYVNDYKNHVRIWVVVPMQDILKELEDNGNSLLISEKEHALRKRLEDSLKALEAKAKTSDEIALWVSAPLLPAYYEKRRLEKWVSLDAVKKELLGEEK